MLWKDTHLATVRNNVDLASLWNVIITDVGGRLSISYGILWHLKQTEIHNKIINHMNVYIHLITWTFLFNNFQNYLGSASC